MNQYVHDELGKRGVDLSKLSEKERQEVTILIKELDRRKKQRKFHTMFPLEGPFRRDLYPKHIEFMSAGIEHKERCFQAANRCISPWTFMDIPNSEKAGGSDTETGHTTAHAHEVLSDSGAYVQAWVGVQEQTVRTNRSFLRGIELAFRVVLDNGQFFDCSRTHQVLTSEGYVSLDQLVSPLSGRRYMSRVQDYQANCVRDGYLHDPQLLAGQDIGLVQTPSRGDALGLTLAWSREDALARSREYMRVCQQHDLPPNQGGLAPSAALFGQFAAPAGRYNVLPLTYVHRVRTRSEGMSTLGPGEFLGERGPLESEGGLAGLVYGETCTSIEWKDVLEYSEQSGHNLAWDAELTLPQSYRAGLYISTFFPWSSPKLVGGRTIRAVVPIGYQPIIDTEVPGVNNYKAGGVFHHNCGKTVAGAFETTCHLTGKYPEWWEGRRFYDPTKIWAAGDTAKTVRDIIQVELIGSHEDRGTGMIPGGDIVRMTPKAGVPDALDTVYVKHYDVDGEQDGLSQLQLKSYDQGRIAFQGTEQDGIWLDEECPMEVYMECLIRTMTTAGIIYLTFTPLKGITDVVMQFMPEGHAPGAS